MKNKHQIQEWKTWKILQQNQVELSSKKIGGEMNLFKK